MAERRESVRLELNDGGFSTQMLKNAAATGLLERALKSLDGTSITIHERISKSAVELDRMSASANKADGSINQLTGRLRLFADAAAILGPALIPLGGVGVAGIAGLASQMGFAAVAGGVLIGSMQGLGDALGALNDAHLDPTAENMAKVEDALGNLSPAAADFAREAYGMLPALREIRDAGAGALFPGLTESLDDLERLAPVVGRIFESVGGALGDIASSSAASLASDRWAGFFTFIADEAPQALTELASTVGSLTHGLAELWMAFTPLNQDASAWMMDAADSFDRWAQGLSQTEGFQEFVDYIRTTGPQVADTLGALGSAMVQIVQAAAPLGGPVLAGIEALAGVIGTIADSDIGTPIMAGVAALSLLNRGLALTKIESAGGLFGGITAVNQSARGTFATMRADVSSVADSMVAFGSNADKAAASSARLKGQLATFGKSAGLLAGVGLAASGAADGIGLTNTASLALMGTVAGPWGAAVGGAAGFLMDVEKSAGVAAEAMTRFNAAMAGGDGGGATDALDELQERLDRLKDTDFASSTFSSFNNLRQGISVQDEIDQLESDLARGKTAVSELTTEQERAASSDAYQRSIEEETAALRDNIAAMRSKRDEAIRSFSAQTNYSQSLLDSKRALEENGRAWGLNSEAGLKNRRVVEQQAASWNELNRTQGQTPAQARAARNALEDTAVSLGATRREAERYARELLDIPTALKTKIAADAGDAFAEINALEARLRAIKDESVFINVRQIGSTTMGPRIESADGGTVPKTGRPYADRFPYLLADGEEVTSNRRGQSDRYRPVLKAINADMPRHIIKGMLADGGTAGGNRGGRISGGVIDSGLMKLIESFGGLEKAMKGQEKASERQTTAINEQTEATTKARADVDTVLGKMTTLGAATTAGFRTGLFDMQKNSNVWGGGAASSGGWESNLAKDTAGLEERARLQAALAAAGLNGAAFEAALSEGTNADLSALLNSGKVDQFESDFNRREQLTAATAGAAGQLRFGAELLGVTAVLERQEALEERAQADLREIKIEIKLLNREQRQREAAREVREERNADRTGAAAGAAMRGETVKGHRDKRNRGDT